MNSARTKYINSESNKQLPLPSHKIQNIYNKSDSNRVLIRQKSNVFFKFNKAINKR